MSAFIPRLYVEFPLTQGKSIDLTDAQTHYMVHVLRLISGSIVKVFNGTQGEWRAFLNQESKKKFFLRGEEHLRDQSSPQQVWLAFSPLKKGPMGFLIGKSTELGVARFIPLYTQYGDHKAYGSGKAQAHAIVAAQQLEQLDVPLFVPPVSLPQFLKEHPKDRIIYACLERRTEALSLLEALEESKNPTILIEPEGGFSPEEKFLLKQQSHIKIVTLGSSILRAETAAIVSLGYVLQKSISSCH